MFFKKIIYAIRKSLGLEKLEPYLQQEQREVLLYRARILCWVGFTIYPATILPFNYFFYPNHLSGGLLASIPASLTAFLLFLTLRSNHFKNFFNKYYQLPIFLILGVISNYAQTVNLQVTGGGGGAFFFPYLLIYITFAVFYPGNFIWVLATALSLILSYIFSEWWMARDFGSVQVTTNIIYLIDSAFLCTTANRVFYQYFINDKEREFALEAANKQLKALDEIKSRFFSNITHEFRTPLVATSTLLQSIEERVALDPELKTLLESASFSLGEMLDNVNDLLTQTKSEKGFIEVRWTQLDIINFIRRSIDIFRPLAQKQHIEIKLTNELRDDTGATLEHLDIYVDRTKFKKILNNLIGNAIKFTKGGKIEVRLGSADGFLKIAVQDSGIGIPAAELPHIFEPFSQASNNSMRDVKGTGLGLSIVKDFVEAQHGRIEVQSEQGVGTTFEVFLPLGEAHVDFAKLDNAEVLDEETPVLKTQGPERFEPAVFTDLHPELARLAIVEDNPQVMQALTFVLKDEYNLCFAGDGEAGLALIREKRPDLILSDVMMPKMNGYELVEAVRADPELRRIPLILLTAKADLESKVKGLSEGADEYLSKPFNNQEVRTRIKNLLAHKKLAAEFIHAEKMVGLGQMTAGISHEILNPLAYAKSSAAQVLSFMQAAEIGKISKEDAQKHIMNAMARVQDGLSRVHEIAAALRGVVHQGSVDFQDYDIHEGIESTLKIFHTNYSGNIQVHRSYELQDKVSCRINQLNQVFLNLLGNAAQAMEAQEQGNIWISTRAEGEDAVIEVRDDGPGIPAAIQAKIFTPFFTTKDVGKGTGLGLYISSQIIENHAGTLKLASTPEQGAKFIIRIPLRRGEQHDEPSSIHAHIDRTVAAVQYPHRG